MVPIRVAVSSLVTFCPNLPKRIRCDIIDCTISNTLYTYHTPNNYHRSIELTSALCTITGARFPVPSGICKCVLFGDMHCLHPT